MKIKCDEALGCALVFLASKGLINDFQQFFKEFLKLPLEERESTLKEKLKEMKKGIIEGF